MGGRKFRLGTHRKNEERKRKQMHQRTVSLPVTPVAPLSLTVSISRQLADIQAPNLVVSLPLTAFTASRQPTLEALCSRVGVISLPSQWVVASQQRGSHLTLCKVITTHPLFQASVSFSLAITNRFSWTLSIGQCQVNPANCPVLSSEPVAIDSVVVILKLLQSLDSCKVCVGNSEQEFLDVLAHRLTTPSGSSGKFRKII